MLRAKEIREMRRLAGVSIRRAAKAAGVSDGTVVNFESGRSRPTVQQLALLGELYAQEIQDRLQRLWKLLSLVGENG
jgi:DNA-binding transcriptional regulator YiaG